MCGEITFPPRINYTFRQWFQTIKRRSALKNQRFVTKKKMRRKWSPHISRERSRVLGTNLLSLFFLCSFSAGKTNRRGFFVWEDRGDSIRLELSFPRARTQEFTLKSDSILVAAGFKMFRAKTRIFWQWRPSDRSKPSLAKSFIFWESMEAYTWGFAVFSLFVAAKSYAVRHFTTQIYREAARRATTIRHQPTVLCALFKMAAAGISKWLKGCSLKIEKKISSLGKAFFLYRVY